MQPQAEPGLAQELAFETVGAGVALGRLFRIIGAPAAVVASAAGWFLVHPIDHRFISFSDGAYTYAASVAATNGFHELYRTIALSLPPGVVLGAALVWRASPHVETIRLALAFASTLTALLTYRTARTLFGLSSSAAVIASFLALAGPIHAQFVGLEGEAVITPLALLLALTLRQRRSLASLIVMGTGFFVKLTWAPFFLAGCLALVPRLGRRRAAGAATCVLLAVAVSYAIAIRSFGWSAHDLASQLVYAEAHSGFQIGLVPALALATMVFWWPLLALAPIGLTNTTRSSRYVIAAGAASSLYMLKQGTFFNVLDPLEPFLAILAVAGASALWRRRGPWGRALVVVCSLGAAVHVASVSTSALARALPVPLGADLVNTDNEATVDRLARLVDANSRPDQPVLVNPLLALVAHRREPVMAADWFILHSLASSCRAARVRDRTCTDWSVVKSMARSGQIPVVSVDSNIVSFDPSFRRDVGIEGGSFRRAMSIDAPPLKTTLYVRRLRGSAIGRTGPSR